MGPPSSDQFEENPFERPVPMENNDEFEEIPFERPVPMENNDDDDINAKELITYGDE